MKTVNIKDMITVTDETPVEELYKSSYLPPRICNALHKAGIYTMRELIDRYDYSPDRILTINGLGKVALGKIAILYYIYLNCSKRYMTPKYYLGSLKHFDDIREHFYEFRYKHHWIINRP